MKRNKSNIFVIAALGGLLACSSVAYAQTNSTPPAAGAGGGPRRGQDMQKLKTALDLTPEQEPKYTEIMKDQREKMTALRDDTSLSQEDRRAKMKALTEATDTKMKELLTPAQYTKWEEARKAMRQRLQGGGPKAPGGDTNSVPKSN